MNQKIILLIVSLTTFPAAATASSMSVATKVLYANNASFVIKTVGDGVSVATINYTSPDETCKLLQNNKVEVLNVKNWNKNGISTLKTC